MVRLGLTATILFLLPHSAKIPWRLTKGNIEQFPFGMQNIILFMAFALWLIGKMGGKSARNPFRAYSVFLAVVVAGVFVAMFSGFEADPVVVIKEGKEKITLLLLYFLPLAITRNKEDFTKILIIILLVHTVVGLETLRSGVLGGEAFHDGKRGSGPFGPSWGYRYLGSDVAAAYLAQVIMFFLAIIVIRGTNIFQKGGAYVGAVLIFWGLLATYSRGSLLGFFAGVFAMFLVQGIKPRNLLMAVLVAAVCVWLIPQSTITRFGETFGEEGKLDKSSQMRFDYYEAALAIARDYPMGVGTGQVRKAMSRYLPRIEHGTEEEGKNVVDPHNGFLYVLCENGILGLGVFIWLFWKILHSAREAYFRESLPLAYRAYALGMVGFMVSFAACNMVYANFFKPLVMGTIVFHFGMLAYIKGNMMPVPSTESVRDPATETAASSP